MLADQEIRELLDSRLPELRPDVEAELELVLTRAGSRARRRRAAYVGGLVAAVVVTVIALGHDWQTRADAPDVVDHTPVQAEPLDRRGAFAAPASIEPGRYVAKFGGLTYPTVRIQLDIPDGWGHDDVYAFATGPGTSSDTRRIDLFADVERIGPPECAHDKAKRVAVAGGARGFADLLAGFGTASARLERVTLDGYDGYRVTLPASTGLAAGDCASTVLLPDGFRTLRASHVPGWSSTTWVFTVDDHLVVVSASQGPDVTPAEAQELLGIVESLSFVLP